MTLPRLSSVLSVLILASTASAAVDLSKIERKILREPEYRLKPKYCLLVFGPEAKTRVWLVQDGDTLYVDRNGNGDLTEMGEKVAAEKKEGADDGTYTFKVGDVRDGDLLHKETTVDVSKIIEYLATQDDSAKALLKRDPKARGYRVLTQVEMPGRNGTGIGGRIQQHASTLDVNGVLQFSDRPWEAPVLHFGGPWQVTLFGRHQLTIERESDVFLGVGSLGIGPGSTTWIDYENVIPTDKYPTLDIVYPPNRPGSAPMREHYDMKGRC